MEKKTLRNKTEKEGNRSHLRAKTKTLIYPERDSNRKLKKI